MKSIFHINDKKHHIKEIIRSEFEEQIAFVDYLQLLKDQDKIKLFTALPNNTYTKSWKQKRKQKLEGQKPGFPDICVITNHDIVFIEMKRVKLGVLSQPQKDWQKALNEVGVKTFVARGFDQAKEYIDQVIK